MKPKTILFTFLSLMLLASCGGQTKKTLGDAPAQMQPEEKTTLHTIISPPPPGNTDSRDTTSVIASEKISLSDEIYKGTEVDFLAAQSNGGWKAFANYIQSVRYPKEIKEKEIKGNLSVLFVVEKDGSISNIDILNGIDSEIEKEIIAALQNMPPWKPAKKDGIYVRSNYGFTLIYE